MSDLNYSEEEIKNTDSRENADDEKLCSNKLTKIVFDYDQLDFIKFRLSFRDGFMFGLGVIMACIMISIMIFLILTIVGISFSHLFFKALM